jgi:DNA invertase Pin-like site-specific DNA recombinase
MAKLDRLSRNVSFLFTLRDGGMRFQALDLPDANTLTLTVMIGMAQHEAELISSRTRAALQARKARGQVLGTPRDMTAYSASANAASQAVRTPKADQFAKDILPMIEEGRAHGCASLQSLADYLNDNGARTPRDKLWTATAVQRAIERTQAA